MRRAVRHIRVLAAILVAIAAVHLLREADAVSFRRRSRPSGSGLFWPLQRALQERMPGAAAVVTTLAAFLAAMGFFGWALLYESAEEVAERARRIRTPGGRCWPRCEAGPDCCSTATRSSGARRSGRSRNRV